MNLDGITQELEQVEFPLPKGFEAKVIGWVAPEDYLVSYKVDEFGTTIIVTGFKDEDESIAYTILRLFPMGDTWQLSVDHEALDMEQTMHELLNNVE